MAHLLPFIETRPQCEPPEPAEPRLSPTKCINASSKSALLVENDQSLLTFLRRSLKDEGYTVRTAPNSEEGLRLYRDCAPFNVVVIDYCVAPSNGAEIDYCAPQTHGIELAMAIHKINPSQGIIIAAFDYRSAEEVPRPLELMQIPLLINASNFHLHSMLEKIEVDRAIEGLTSSELLRLRLFADFRVRGLGRAARGRTGEDLLGEALLRTLIGVERTGMGRRWNKDVDFVQHLTGAMRSISSCWKRQFVEKQTFLMSELQIFDAEGGAQSPLDNVASAHTQADQQLIEKDEERRVLSIFKDDPLAIQVLRGLLDGLRKAEILSRFGFDEKKYAAAVKRIRLKLLGRGNAGGRGERHGR